MFCRNCGQLISDTAAFCVNCGAQNPAKSPGDSASAESSAAGKGFFSKNFDDPFSEPEMPARTSAPEPAPAPAPAPVQPVYQQQSAAPPVQPVYPQQPAYQQPVYQQRPAYPQPMYNQPPSYLNPTPGYNFGNRPPVQLSGFAKSGVFLMLLLGIAGVVMLFFGKIIGIPEMSISNIERLISRSDRDSIDYEYYSIWNFGEEGSESGYNYFKGLTSLDDAFEAIEEMDKVMDDIPDKYRPAYRSLKWLMIDCIAVYVLNIVAVLIAVICGIMVLVRYSSGEYYKAWSHAGNILRIVLVAQIFELLIVVLARSFMRNLLEAEDSSITLGVFRYAPHLLISIVVVIVGLVICGSNKTKARAAAFARPYYG